MSDELLTGDQVVASDLPDWRPVLSGIEARFGTGDFMTGLRLVQAVAEAAEEANHHPDVDLRYGYVHVRLSSHDVGGITQRDLDLARRVSDLAREVDAAADPAVVQRLEVGLDTHDAEEVAPFWAAVYGPGAERRRDDVLDATGQLPTLWFQRSEPSDDPPQRFHLDLWVPPEQVDARIEAAVAAGGTLVTDEFAPSFWVLADPQGNKVCLCTHRERPA